MKTERLDHVHLYVKDLEASKELYSRTLGTHFSDCPPDQDLGMRVSLSPLGLEIIEPTSPDSIVGRTIRSRGEGVAALSFKVPDIELAIADLQSQGLRLVGRVNYAHLKEAQFHPRDWHGVMLELCQYEDRHPVYYAARGLV